LDGDKHFIPGPGVTKTFLPFLELASVSRPKLLTPFSYGFIDDGNPAFGKQFIDFTKAAAE